MARRPLATLPAEHADLIGRFARWQVLRSLRRNAERGTLTQGTISAGRATIVTAVRFLAWLEVEAPPCPTLTQADLDRYVVEHPAGATLLAPFVCWAPDRSRQAQSRSPPASRPMPIVALSDAQRWAQVELLLHDDSIRLYARVAGLFTLLFAQPLARICGMRADQIGGTPDGRSRSASTPSRSSCPNRSTGSCSNKLARQGQASYASVPTHGCSPAPSPAGHLHQGIRANSSPTASDPAQARKAAMFQLAAEIPTPILADILGLGPTPPSDGRPSQPATGATTPPPCDSPRPPPRHRPIQPTRLTPSSAGAHQERSTTTERVLIGAGGAGYR